MSDLIEGILNELGVEYQLVACDPDLADTAAFCDAYGYELADSANTIIVVGKGAAPVFAACVVLANARLDVNGVVRKRLGTRKASFASAEQTVEVTGMLIGGVTPVGLPEDLPIWIDSAVMTRERIVLGGGGRDSKIVCAPSIFERLANCDVVEGLASIRT